MAFIPWPNSVKVILEFTIAGIPVTVTIAVTKPAALETGDVTDVANFVKSWAASSLMPNLCTAAALTRVTAYDMTSSTGEVVVLTAGLPVSGTVPDQSIDIGSALDVSFRTANRGRSGRGRNYVPGIAMGDRANAAQFLLARTNDIAADYVALNTALVTPGFAHTVASEQLDGVVRNPAVMQAVTSYIGNLSIANQRRRGLFSG